MKAIQRVPKALSFKCVSVLFLSGCNKINYTNTSTVDSRLRQRFHGKLDLLIN